MLNQSPLGSEWLYWLCRGKLWYFWVFFPKIIQSQENLIWKLVACYKPFLLSPLSIFDMCTDAGIFFMLWSRFWFKVQFYEGGEVIIYRVAVYTKFTWILYLLPPDNFKTWQKNRSRALWGCCYQPSYLSYFCSVGIRKSWHRWINLTTCTFVWRLMVKNRWNFA